MEIPGCAEYIFGDGLKLDKSINDWEYCTLKDRRFWPSEYEEDGVLGAPANVARRVRIPKGTYDVGNGYFDPISKNVYAYPGKEVLELPP